MLQHQRYELTFLHLFQVAHQLYSLELLNQCLEYLVFLLSYLNLVDRHLVYLDLLDLLFLDFLDLLDLPHLGLYP